MRYCLASLGLLLWSQFSFCSVGFDELSAQKYAHLQYNRDGLQMEPPPSTMYLVREVKPSDPETLILYERCLLTYLWMTVDQKKLTAEEPLNLQLQSKILTPFAAKSSFSQMVMVADGLNAILPHPERSYSRIIRKQISRFIPSLELRHAIQELKDKDTLAASYIEYLFEDTKNECNQEFIYTSIIANCKNALNEIELLTLLSIHALGRDGKTNHKLAKKEVECLEDSRAFITATLILRLASLS